MDLQEGVLAYYLLSCANLSDEQTALCRATCMDLTYDDMKKQIERVSTNNESSTSTSTTQIKVKAEQQYSYLNMTNRNIIMKKITIEK